jgi:glycosyltransferase involved in cell wall biosynthesis
VTDRALLVLSRYHEMGASSRLRLFQYVPALEQAGFEVTLEPFFDQAYLDELYGNGRRRAATVLRSYLKRLTVLLRARRFSAAWIEKEMLPFFPGAFESWLSLSRVPYVVDYDDAIFHTYDRHRSALVRRLLGNRLDPLLRGASCVTAGNEYLLDYAQRHGARKAVLVPTVVDTLRYDVRPEPEGKEFRVGWIGSPATSKYLEAVLPALRQLSRRRPLRLVTIGAPALECPDLPLEQHDWAEATEAALIASFHVGVMPLPDTPWERGKCGYKLVQYMACGRPVVASPVGVNCDIVGKGVGLLAASEADWVEALERLAADPNYRAGLGSRARSVADNEYSLAAVAPRVIDVLEGAACAA